MSQKKKSGKQRKAERKSTAWVGTFLGVFFSILAVIAIVFVMLIVTPRVYRFGYSIFAEKPGSGVEIEVEFVVAEGETAQMTAERLRNKGLIDSEWVFLLQKFLYEKDIIAGPHTLHSNMTTLEILDALSQAENAP